MPSNQIPGKVSNIDARPTPGEPGNITVQWNFPRVPAHNIFCAGGGPFNISDPDPCPSGMGLGTQADGGAPILHYQVQWDTNKFFNSSDPYPKSGQALITNLAGGEPFDYTIRNLTSTDQYWIRVYAHNDMGTGAACNRAGLLCDSSTELSVVPSG